jgi:hypothetical protein
MAKRARGSISRPGQRAPLQRNTSAPRPSANTSSTTPTPSAQDATSGAAPPVPQTLTAAEEARAATLEASIVADEKSAEAATRERDRRRTEAATVRAGSLAARADDEYAYVTRDLRRIAIIGGSMIALLLGLWIVVAVTGVGPF